MCIFHTWSKWSDVTDTNYTYTKRQFRKCIVCGKVISRTVSLGDSAVPAEIINEVVR